MTGPSSIHTARSARPDVQPRRAQSRSRGGACTLEPPRRPRHGRRYAPRLGARRSIRARAKIKIRSAPSRIDIEESGWSCVSPVLTTCTFEPPRRPRHGRRYAPRLGTRPGRRFTLQSLHRRGLGAAVRFIRAHPRPGHPARQGSPSRGTDTRRTDTRGQTVIYRLSTDDAVLSLPQQKIKIQSPVQSPRAWGVCAYVCFTKHPHAPAPHAKAGHAAYQRE